MLNRVVRVISAVALAPLTALPATVAVHSIATYLLPGGWVDPEDKWFYGLGAVLVSYVLAIVVGIPTHFLLTRMGRDQLRNYALVGVCVAAAVGIMLVIDFGLMHALVFGVMALVCGATVATVFGLVANAKYWDARSPSFNLPDVEDS